MIQGFKLKRCPFCGGQGKIEESRQCLGHGEYIEYTYVRCIECGSEGRHCSDREYGVCAKLMAADFWNKRKLFIY